MANFKRVDKEPEKLKENECVIIKPDFLEEIKSTKKRRGQSGLTTVPYLRDIFMTITDKYDHSVNPYQMKLSKYNGLAYESDEDLVKIIFKIINDLNLDLLEKAVDHKVKNRPEGKDMIYYVSDDLEGTGAFIKNGINMDTKKNQKKVTVKE